jgi:hypothetical protein
MSPQENRNHATNAVPAQDVSAGSFNSSSSVSRPDDIGAQLGRLETILDRILRSLAPLVGA